MTRRLFFSSESRSSEMGDGSSEMADGSPDSYQRFYCMLLI